MFLLFFWHSLEHERTISSPAACLSKSWFANFYGFFLEMFLGFEIHLSSPGQFIIGCMLNPFVCFVVCWVAELDLLPERMTEFLRVIHGGYVELVGIHKMTRASG